MGRDITKPFVESNARVISSYVNDREIYQVKTEIKSATVRLTKDDITKEGKVDEWVSNIICKYGRIHVLVNVVGGYLTGKEHIRTWWKRIGFDDYYESKSAFLISKHVVSQMISSKYRKIIHVSSRTDLQTEGYDSAYAASKSWRIMLVESVSEETKISNINVNCIMPYIIDTEGNEKSMPNADFNKWVKPEDLVDVVLFWAQKKQRPQQLLLYLLME